MPNIATVLKQEISRLARREIRASTAALRKDNAVLKRTVAQLKRRMATLERDSRLLKAAEKRLREAATESKVQREELQGRITAKGVRSLRSRLGLTRKEFAALSGVSKVTVYFWESKEGPLKLRQESKAALLELRAIGAREARRRLAAG